MKSAGRKQIHSDNDLSLQRLAENAIEVLDELEALQVEQREDVQAGKIKGLVVWREKRQQVFWLLQQCFADIEKNVSRLDHDSIRVLLERLKMVMSGEARLSEVVAQKRETLRGRLSAIRKGKATLQKYRVHGAVSKPRFLSNKT